MLAFDWRLGSLGQRLEGLVVLVRVVQIHDAVATNMKSEGGQMDSKRRDF